ncbi:MAG TPA: hypothetical protein VGG41_05690 [Solirubrobacteraceae bacterium]|jgi:hypothetical protein
MRSRHPLAVLAAIAAAVAIAACGGGGHPSNGVASKSASAILARTRTALSSAKSVHVAGSIKTSTLAIGLDLTLASGRGGQGQMTLNGRTVEIKTIGKVAYFNASPAFWKQYAGAAAARFLHGNWLKMPTSTTAFASVIALTNMHELFESFLGSGNPVVVKGKTTTIGGRSAIGVVNAASGGTLYVATTGRPLPVAFVRTGGHLVFDRYNAHVSLKPPSHTFSILNLK